MFLPWSCKCLKEHLPVPLYGLIPSLKVRSTHNINLTDNLKGLSSKESPLGKEPFSLEKKSSLAEKKKDLSKRLLS